MTSVWCVSAVKAPCGAGALDAAECTTAVSFAPSLRPPTLITTAPSKDPKMQSHHHLLSPPHALHVHCVSAIDHPHATCPFSASSRPPRSPSSAPDAHWPLLEAWYLGSIRIASASGVYSLTCEEAEGASVWCVGAVKPPCGAGALGAAECTTAPSFAPSLR